MQQTSRSDEPRDDAFVLGDACAMHSFFLNRALGITFWQNERASNGFEHSCWIRKSQATQNWQSAFRGSHWNVATAENLGSYLYYVILSAVRQGRVSLVVTCPIPNPKVQGSIPEDSKSFPKIPKSYAADSKSKGQNSRFQKLSEFIFIFFGSFFLTALHPFASYSISYTFSSRLRHQSGRSRKKFFKNSIAGRSGQWSTESSIWHCYLHHHYLKVKKEKIISHSRMRIM